MTVPPEEGRFTGNDSVPAARRAAVTKASAAYALALPRELATGPGTGAAPVPTLPVPVAVPSAVRTSLSRVIDSLLSFREHLHGGSS